MAGLERDCIFVNCDTILAGVDVGEFVNLFYSSLATVSGLFFRPAEKELVEDKTAEKGGKGKSHQAFTPAPFQYRYCSVAYDEEDVVSAMTTGAEQQNPSQCASEDRQRGLNHSLLQHRLYFMSPYEGAEAAISVAFAARRPNLTCTADVVDTGVYALRSWVLHFMDKSDEFDNDCTLQELALSPTILRSQHTQVNTAAGIYNTPDRKLHYTVPLHWMYNDKNESICVLNAANGIHLPARGDSVRVFATILEEKADIPRRVYRIDSLENYKSVSQELVLRKCYSLGLLEGAAPKKGAEVGLPKVSGVPPSLDPSAGGPPLSSFALAHLLRDNPITLKEKLGSLKLYISGSYLVTPVNPGCYVTNSIIGPGVRLGEGARVTNSIILRGAEIGEKAQILNSVVGAEAGVAANKTIRASVIGTWCQVEEDVTDEVILPNE
ncbi:hypothetical protein, conserved [Angomonas deanei]|uniref:Mannose-1-phosphate guanyltransferase C-terminal domain-containing protein n=1 Tax=Angomonas deanei TaxID=59799 RepID=A0A7G2CG91_9TRYP|nr:hypothetical protein, conserved [Angomonas deanei]